MWDFVADNPYLIVIAYVLILSVITFVFYVSDKRRAKAGSRRISEKTLLLLSILGGAAGGYIAMLSVRHKTKAEHWYFTAVNIIGIIAWIAAIILLAVFV